MAKESKLDNKNWVIEYITKWIEKNTKFKVKSIEIGENERQN